MEIVEFCAGYDVKIFHDASSHLKNYVHGRADASDVLFLFVSEYKKTFGDSVCTLDRLNSILERLKRTFKVAGNRITVLPNNPSDPREALRSRLFPRMSSTVAEAKTGAKSFSGILLSDSYGHPIVEDDTGTISVTLPETLPPLWNGCILKFNGKLEKPDAKTEKEAKDEATAELKPTRQTKKTLFTVESVEHPLVTAQKIVLDSPTVILVASALQSSREALRNLRSVFSKYASINSLPDCAVIAVNEEGHSNRIHPSVPTFYVQCGSPYVPDTLVERWDESVACCSNPMRLQLNHVNICFASLSQVEDSSKIAEYVWRQRHLPFRKSVLPNYEALSYILNTDALFLFGGSTYSDKYVCATGEACNGDFCVFVVEEENTRIETCSYSVPGCVGK